MEDLQVEQVDKPRCWKVIMVNVEAEREEAVLSFQGVIVQKNLPPINGKM
jgi:hypothetical protein